MRPALAIIAPLGRIAGRRRKSIGCNSLQHMARGCSRTLHTKGLGRIRGTARPAACHFVYVNRSTQQIAHIVPIARIRPDRAGSFESRKCRPLSVLTSGRDRYSRDHATGYIANKLADLFRAYPRTGRRLASSASEDPPIRDNLWWVFVGTRPHPTDFRIGS